MSSANSVISSAITGVSRKMNLIKDGDDAVRAEDCLRALLETGVWLLAPDGADAAVFPRVRFELRIEWRKLLFSWWNEDEGVVDTTRVIGFDVREDIVRLLVRRGIARAPVVLTLCRSTRDVTLERTRYLSQARRVLKDYDERIDIRSASVGAHRTGTLRMGYARLVLERLGTTLLAIGVGHFEGQQLIDGIVEMGLVWVSRFNQTRAVGDQARELWFLLPMARSQTVIERLTLISTDHLGVRVRCFEIDADATSLRTVDIVAQMELLSARARSVSWPGAQALDAATEALVARLVALAPDAIEVRPVITGRGEKFVINGLEFARTISTGRSGILFGVHRWRWLTDDTFSELVKLVREILHWRRADSPDRRNFFYRLRAEAWLESIIRRDIAAFDPGLDERFVYSQVPTWRGDERSVIDLLAIDRNARLVVIEIKASEDPMLPLQGLDYWLRVEEARRQGQFTQRGLFPGVSIADRSPLLYLVTPRLRFHRTFLEVSRCLAAEVEAWRIGVNANWRVGLRVVSRERVNRE